VHKQVVALASGVFVAGGLAFLYFRGRDSGASGDVLSDIADSVEAVAVSAKNLIAGNEGLSLTAYQDSGGAWTIGYGHLIRAGERYYPYGPVREITLQEANQLFDADTAVATRAVDTLVVVPLSDNQREALISFVFNVGVGAFQSSTLLRVLNQGNFAQAAAEFLRWNKDDGVVVDGLTARRERERELFLNA